jgi:hypothetical protein
MTQKDIGQRLEELKRNKANHSLAEIESLLRDAEFSCREGKGSHVVWCRGKQTLTLPRPHGGDKALKVPYVSEVIRRIEAAELEAQQESEEERDEPSDA